MIRSRWIAALVLCLCFAQAAIAAPPNNGYIGVFGDKAGTRCCFNTNADGTERMYVYAFTGGATSAGITGAEFRVSVETPAPGDSFLWLPSGNLSISQGDPIDNGNGGGLTLTFASCMTTTGQAGDMVKLGEIYARDLFGEHRIVVRRTDSLANANFACPSLMLCDGPSYTQVCLTLNEGDPALGGEEPAGFVSAVNSQSCSGVTCGFVATHEQTWTAVKDLYR